MITQLPTKYNNCTYIKEIIERKCGTSCPFCGENHFWTEYLGKDRNRGIGYNRYSWYGKRHEGKNVPFKILFCNLFKKSRFWRKDKYYCWTCGAGWETPAYPTEQLSPKEFAEIVEEIEKELDEWYMVQ